VDEPISRRGGAWLVLLLAIAIVGGLAAAVVTIGESAANPFAQAGAQVGSTSRHAECLGCGARQPVSASGPVPAASGSALQRATQSSGRAPGVRPAATGGRAAAPPAVAPQPALPAPAAAGTGGLCGTIGRTGPPLLQTLLAPVAAVCDVLL
jgi:hypothetical protein